MGLPAMPMPNPILAGLFRSLRAPRVLACALAMLLGLSFAALAGAQQAQRAGPRRAVLVVDPAWLDDDALHEEIDAYQKRVRADYGYELLVEPMAVTCSPSELRERLQHLHATRKICGALLAGEYPLPRFDNACGDQNALYAYYGDLDGDFAGSEPVFDHYQPWPHRDAPVMELWIAVLRPYHFGKPDGRSAADVAALFRRWSPKPKKSREPVAATLVTTKDWANQRTLTGALESAFGRVTALGTEPLQGARAPIGPAEFRQALANRGDLLFVFAHSGPRRHHLDVPDGAPGTVVPNLAPGEPAGVGLEQAPVQSRAVVVWGCHGLDLRKDELGDERFLADAYLMAAGSRAEVVVGASRSIGMEAMETLVGLLPERVLCDAWLDYENQVYSQDFLAGWLGVRDAWDKERGRFDWGYVLYGNPFVRLDARRDGRK